jgi:hypothetical protein
MKNVVEKKPDFVLRVKILKATKLRVTVATGAVGIPGGHDPRLPELTQVIF